MSVLSKTEGEKTEINYSGSCLIDTNGFMIPVQFGVDIFSELNRLGFFKFLTVPAVLRELESLSQKVSGSDKSAVRIALQLAKKCQIVDTESLSKKYADDIIFNFAVEKGVAVLTNDVQLRQRLNQSGVPVISMRQTSRLDFVSQK